MYQDNIDICPLEVIYIEYDEPVWTTNDGYVIPISEMSTSHIKNCIKLINKSNGNWRGNFKRYFEEELRKRKYTDNDLYVVKDSYGQVLRTYKDYKSATTYLNTFGNSGWYIEEL